MSELHAQQLTDLEGNEQSLSDYAGKILLLVNVASRCGKTHNTRGWKSCTSAIKNKDSA